jgi:hypothetical protein
MTDERVGALLEKLGEVLNDAKALGIDLKKPVEDVARVVIIAHGKEQQRELKAIMEAFLTAPSRVQ